MGEKGIIIVEGERYVVPPEMIKNINKLLNGNYEKEIVTKILNIIKEIKCTHFQKANNSRTLTSYDFDDEISKQGGDETKCDVLWGQMRYHDGEMSALNSLVKEIEEILIKTYNITHDSIS